MDIQVEVIRDVEIWVAKVLVEFSNRVFMLKSHTGEADRMLREKETLTDGRGKNIHLWISEFSSDVVFFKHVNDCVCNGVHEVRDRSMMSGLVIIVRMM